MNSNDESSSAENMAENLVMFPSAKNYRPDLQTEMGDPLEDLLNEFGGLSDDDFDFLDEELFSLYSDKEMAAPVPPSQLSDNMNQLDLFLDIKDQLAKLQETQSRMSFLLDEIENFFPK